jgi:hypothetical protein
VARCHADRSNGQPNARTLLDVERFGAAERRS